MEFSKKKFKSDYYKYGPQNLEAQFPHLLKLANLYLDKAKATGIWTDYVKVCGYPSRAHPWMTTRKNLLQPFGKSLEYALTHKTVLNVQEIWV